MTVAAGRFTAAMVARDRRAMTRALAWDTLLTSAEVTGVEDQAIAQVEGLLHASIIGDELDAMCETDWQGVSVY